MIEGDLAFLKEAVQALHNHKWVRWARSGSGAHTATCKCGVDKVVTKAEYAKLPPSYEAKW